MLAPAQDMSESCPTKGLEREPCLHSNRKRIAEYRERLPERPIRLLIRRIALSGKTSPELKLRPGSCVGSRSGERCHGCVEVICVEVFVAGRREEDQHIRCAAWYRCCVRGDSGRNDIRNQREERSVR